MAMINAPHRGDGRRGQSTAALQRDAALLRISRTRRWLIAAAAAGSAGVAALVSSVAPGHTLGSKSKAGSLRPAAAAGAGGASNAAVSNKMPPLASPAALGLQGPSSAPQSSSDPSQSGGSAQSTPDPSQAASDPAQAAPVPAPAPTPAPAVSGGS